ncbi:HNH endonuclease [Virgibacillus sp. SK37]|uniref:HNH endonuclease n=1 Tax=Virgibacillus sp. SK37 TaxID=403957 RepID=UPI0011A1A5A9|nr:HNH endonuclease [Virgibacillus sp. SK37]
MNCYVCNSELTKENETEEHIILNAIGGKLKSRSLICKDCNSKFGSRVDNKLAEQLNPICNLLDVKRDRGKPQNVKATYKNKEILIEPGGKMKLARAYTHEDGKVVHIESATEGQAVKALRGLKRKYPSLNTEELLENAKRKKEYLDSVSISMNFGGKETTRAICKMAVNFFIFNGGDPKYIKQLLPFILGIEEEAEVYFFYPRSELFYKNEKDILHTLLLVGDPNHRYLYVYVELFNEFKMVVYLSKEYDEEPIYESYHYNVITNQVFDYSTPVRIQRKDLKKYSTNELDIKRFQERLKSLLQRIDKITVDRRISEITNKAMEEMIKRYPQEDNPYFTEEMIAFLSERVAVEFVLSFQNRLNTP